MTLLKLLECQFAILTTFYLQIQMITVFKESTHCNYVNYNSKLQFEEHSLKYSSYQAVILDVTSAKSDDFLFTRGDPDFVIHEHTRLTVIMSCANVKLGLAGFESSSFQMDSMFSQSNSISDYMSETSYVCPDGRHRELYGQFDFVLDVWENRYDTSQRSNC